MEAGVFGAFFFFFKIYRSIASGTSECLCLDTGHNKSIVRGYSYENWRSLSLSLSRRFPV